jgi:hypothetical protein
LRVVRRCFWWLAAFTALLVCSPLSGCGRSEYGSLDLSKSNIKLGLEGEVMPLAKAAPRPAGKKGR